MKTKKILHAFLTTALISVSLLLDAQTKFYINKKDGTANQYNIADVDSISFAPSSSSTVVDPTPLNMNVSLVASSENSLDIPIVDVTNKTLDLGANPILIIGNKSFDFKSIWPSNPENYRAIPLTSTSANDQRRVLYFNINTKLFELYKYNLIATLDDNRVLFGTINNPNSSSSSSYFNVNLPFPFRYSNTSASVITGSLKYKPNATMSMHRGLCLSGIAPENSLDAAVLAARAGYDWIEGDMQLTSDGELVITHDNILNSSTFKYAADYSDIPSNINVNYLTLDELRKTYVLASPNPGMRKPIPTLEEMFITCRNNHIKPLMEIKTGFTQADMLKAYNLGSEILGDDNFAFSGGYALLDYIRTLSDKVDLFYLSGSLLGAVNTINGQSREHPHNILAQGILTAEQIKEYHLKKMRVAIGSVGVDTFDDMLNLGYDYIEGAGVGPNLDGRPGNVVTADGNWDKFSTNGTVSNFVLLNNGQWIKWNAFNKFYLSAYYLKVTFKGSINIITPKYNIKRTAGVITSFITQVLIYNGINNPQITAQADGTEIYNIEFLGVDL